MVWGHGVGFQKNVLAVENYIIKYESRPTRKSTYHKTTNHEISIVPSIHQTIGRIEGENIRIDFSFEKLESYLTFLNGF